MDMFYFTLPVYPCSYPVFSQLKVAQSLVFSVLCFVDLCLCIRLFTFDHCIFCYSSIYKLFGIIKDFCITFCKKKEQLETIKGLQLIN